MTASALDLERIGREPLIAKVEWHATLPSTNDRALELAAEVSLDTPILILADEQTAGRGRGSNRWWSQAGALTLSLVLDPARIAEASLHPEQWPRIALAAGVSLCDTLVGLAPHLDCGLKWPNDVLIAGKKVAGILVEIPRARTQVPRRIVLGMGVNLNNSLADAPAEIRERGTALCDETGLEFDATQILLNWIERLAENLHLLADENAELAARWQSRCVLRGKTVELQAGDRIVRGLCRGIDTDGALLLDSPAGPERLYGGVLVRTSS